MKRASFIALALAVLALPVTSFAAEPLTRRDGFLEIWQSIRRPAAPIKTQFSDVPEPARGSLEIDYAASRGIIDEDENDKAFHPDDPLILSDALTWLFRTRNVTDDPKDVNPDTMTGILLRYPIAHFDDTTKSSQISQDQLLELMRLLDTELTTEEHEVSLYAEKFNGKGTAFGESFDMYALTAAHRSFPPNTLVKVTNVDNGKSVVVRINDRGPYVSGRDMDLSLAAFTTIADRSRGKFQATFQRLGDASMVSTCSDESPQQQRLNRRAYLTRGVPHTLKLGNTLTLASAKPFVMRGVTYPDGNTSVMQDFILPSETYTFTPAVEGAYSFSVGAGDGRFRTMEMTVVKCGQ